MNAVNASALSHLDSLNLQQRAAASYLGEDSTGPLLVIAGAGTGKTTTLAHRVAHLVLNGVSADRILLLTFSRRAAAEMTRRAERIVSKVSSGNTQRFEWAGTYHSVGNRILRHYAHNVGLEANFSILDRGDAADLMDVARQELKLSRVARRFPKKDACLAIYSRRMNSQKPLQQCLQEAYPWCSEWDDELKQLFRRYLQLKQKHQCLDYDDLLLYWYHLVQDNEIAQELGACFDHILVDEYQDSNRLQAEILLAMKPSGHGLTAVGDDAQSIYSFRAAEIDNILGFAEQFSPPAQQISLETNYRSIQPVLDLANALMSESDRAIPKHLVSNKSSKQKPCYVSVEDVNAEADYVVEQILAGREAGQRLMDQAVLFRNSHHSDRLELELTRRNIPFVKYGGLKFLEAAHVKDLLSILKWADNPKNQPAAYRVLQLLPGIGPSTAAKCFDFLALSHFEWRALSDFAPGAAAAEYWPELCAVMAVLGQQSTTGTGTGDSVGNDGWQQQLEHAKDWYLPHMEQRLDAPEQREADLEQLIQIARNYPNRERFLTELTLDPPSASGDLAGDALVDEDYLILSTVHSAKGQEWESVYVLNVTDGNFPNEFATHDEEQIEEERRLLYVAMTRAKRNLHLTVPLKFPVTQQQRHGDKHVYGTRSRFFTKELLTTMEQRFHGDPMNRPRRLGKPSQRNIDVAAKVMAMF